MEKKKTKQIYIYQFDHPFEALLGIFSKYETMELICKDEDFKIKKFIGSDWSIKDSGFIYYDTNNQNIAFALKNIEKNDFNRKNIFQISHINGKQFRNEIYFIGSLIRNTSNNSTIMEFRLEYNYDSELDELEKYVKISEVKKIIMKIYSKIDVIIQDPFYKNSNTIIIINHSFIIKKNYKDAFNFFYNWNNLAKSIKTDKSWKIFNENNNEKKKYKDFSILINENIKINYQVINIEEVKNKKIEISYRKTSNSSPALNDYIKFSFFYLAKDICFFLYETHLPINISSSIYQTTSSYVYYCNKKSKNYIENKL